MTGGWARFRRNRLAVAGLVVVLVILLAAAAAPWLPLADPDATNLAARLRPPLSEGYWLGADQLGRDLLARLLWGAQASLGVGLAATAIAVLVGSLIGLVAGYRGGWLDTTLMRGIDVLMAFPYLLLALAIVAALGPGLFNALLAVAVVNIPFFARTVRGVVVGLAGRDFVAAARLGGQSEVRVLFRELLPNVLPAIVITATTTVGWMILETAGLSFLGLGAQPPRADLGSMLGEGRALLLTAPHVSVLPGLLILVLVMGINLLGDGVRDLLDPRLRAGALAAPGAVTERADLAVPLPPPEPFGEQPLLSVRGLRTWFYTGEGVLKAVDEVSFQLRRGECLGLVGESGSGKSVTALSLLGLTPSPPGRIIGGSVRYRGEELLGAPLSRLRTLRGGPIAYVFQDPQTTLNPLFTVGDQLAEAIRAHAGGPRDAARRRAVELLEQVDLPDPERAARRYPHTLSGGQRQRVVIAMALANDPEILICDEPTTALDVTTQARVLRLLGRQRRSQDASLLFITHDFGIVSELCDRVLVMYAGKVVESGPVDELLADPQHPYTQRLLACVPRLGQPRQARKAIPGLPPRLDDLPMGCAFAPRCDHALESCRQGPVVLTTFAPGRAVRCVRAGAIHDN